MEIRRAVGSRGSFKASLVHCSSGPLRRSRWDALRGRISVIVNTYERPDALDVVLRALSEQSERNFEVLVAEDASNPRVAELVHDWSPAFGVALRHIAQPDEGYRRARVVNLAALEARGDYLVFVDGDCIPRRCFLRALRRAALAGWFLSTQRIKLSQSFTTRVLAEGLPIWRWSPARWLVQEPAEIRRPGLLIPLRDRRRPWRADEPDFVPPDNAYGFLCAMHRRDFEQVNGWDARFVGWGNDDIDLVSRLRAIGLRCSWPGPGATMFHLWHPEGRDPADPRFVANERLLFETLESGRIEAVHGIRELEAESGNVR